MVSEGDECITYYKHFRDSLSKKTVEGRLDKTYYQGIKLKNYYHFQDVEQIKTLYIDLTTIITHTMSYRFGDLQQSPLFEHLVMLLVTSIWAKDSSANTEKVVSKIFAHFKPSLEKTVVF